MSDSSLGCYSVIRYRDALSDQQVNLGVLLWHPREGYRVFFVPNLDVARAIAPKLESQELRFRLNVIEQQVNQNGKSGPEKFKELCSWFRDGVEVTSPYPAKFEDLDSALHLLRPTLFPQTPTLPTELALMPDQFLAVPHLRTAATQFERKVFRTIETAAEHKQIQVEPLQPRKIGKLVVNPGLRTISSRRKALWRALSFQSRENPERRLFHAKAVAMEMHVVSGLEAFKKYSRCIVLQNKPESSTDELVAWLRRSADHVFPVENPEGVRDFIDRAL